MRSTTRQLAIAEITIGTVSVVALRTTAIITMDAIVEVFVLILRKSILLSDSAILLL